MGRSPCCDESGLKKGPWTPEEDEILVNYIKKHGHGSWRALPKLAGLNRCGKSCRLRWTNYLRPDIKRGKFSPEEEKTILNLHAVLGNKWSAIAGHLPGRTDNEIKNYWNTHLKKRLLNSGIDPMTHRPRTDIFSSLPHLLALVNLKELMDHHSLEEHALRIQAEAMAKLQYLQSLLQTPPTSSVAIPSPNTSNNHINGLTDMETLKLLSSLPQQEASCVSPTFGSLSHNTLRGGCFSFPRLPELQNPCSFQSTLSKDNSMIQAQVPESAVISQAEDSLNFHWQPSKSPKSSPQLLVDDAPDAAAITNRHGDPCITSSLDGVSCSSWPDILLEDPSFSSLLS